MTAYIENLVRFFSSNSDLWDLGHPINDNSSRLKKRSKPTKMIECAFFGREKKIPTRRGMPGEWEAYMADQPSTGHRQGLKPGTVGWGTKAQCFCPLYLKTWFFYVVFNAELNGTIRILCFCHAIIDLLWPSWALLIHRWSIMVWRKRKILMVPINSALKTTQKNQVFEYGGQKHWAFIPHPTVIGAKIFYLHTYLLFLTLGLWRLEWSP